METKKQSVLAVDDNATNLKMINEICRGNYKVYSAPSGARALAFLEKTVPDIILLDVEMPEMDGFEVIRRIKDDPRLSNIPVLFLTGTDARTNEELAFKYGAVDYISKPVLGGVLLARLALHLELVSYRENLEGIVMAKILQIERTQDAILEVLANVTNYRDNDTGGHIMRTTAYVQKIVDRLMQCDVPGYKVAAGYAVNIIKSAKLHDIGKVAIPDSILLKPGKLEPQEFEFIKLHTTVGAHMIDQAIADMGVDSALLAVAKEIVLSHHERWDGRGYPAKLSGETIPLSARIMVIADVYDALISPRPYKGGMSHEAAMNIIYNMSPGHFDPNIMKICADVIEDFKDIAVVEDDMDSEIARLLQ